MSEQKTLPFREKLELLLLTDSEEAKTRAKGPISRAYLTFKHASASFLLQPTGKEFSLAQVVLLTQEKEETLATFSSRVDSALAFFPRAHFIIIMASNLSRDNVEGITNPRVTALSQNEFYHTLKFEYLCLYFCRAQYFEVQLADFFSMTEMLHPTYLRLSLNQRYLAVIYSHHLLTDAKVARLTERKGEIFIRNRDAGSYASYIAKFYDKSGTGLRRRARSLFLYMTYLSLRLNEQVMFDFKSSPDAHVMALFEELKGGIEQFVDILRQPEDLWETLREAWDGGDFSLYWRAPWVGAYAALISVKSQVGDPKAVLLAALLADIGLYDLQEVTAREYLLSEEMKVSDEQISEFKKHPILSLNRALIRKLPLEELVKSIIVCSHEQADEKGFPNQVPKDKLPVEAQLLLFAEKIDKEVLTTMAKNGVGFRFAKEKLWETEKNAVTHFSVEFLEAIAASLI